METHQLEKKIPECSVRPETSTKNYLATTNGFKDTNIWSLNILTTFLVNFEWMLRKTYVSLFYIFGYTATCSIDINSIFVTHAHFQHTGRMIAFAFLALDRQSATSAYINAAETTTGCGCLWLCDELWQLRSQRSEL